VSILHKVSDQRKRPVILLFLLITILYPQRSLLEGKEEDKVVKLCCSPRTGDLGLPDGWQNLTFKGINRHTRYMLKSEAGIYLIESISQASASGIFKEVNLDPKIYQRISWRWKVKKTLEKGDARRKEGDDYSARIYVTFQYDPDKVGRWERIKFFTIKTFYGKYPPLGAINYIWANKLPKGESVDNAFTNRAKMIAIESGNSLAGKWVKEGRNLYQDYKELFREEPPLISSVAIMTDTDNTGESAEAYYADIFLYQENQ
jgi:hypothetical protein